jgi:hypothetical protein
MRIAFGWTAVLLAFASAVFAQPPQQPLQTTSGTGFAGAPYSGRETTVTVRTLADGTTTTETFVQLLWRDAEGRTRREMIRHTPSGAEYRSVIVTDPVGGFFLKWTIDDEAARRVMQIWPMAAAQKATATLPSNSPPPARPASTPAFRREVLPPQEINGVYAEGTRTVRTVRLEEESSNRVIEVSNELWISPDLKIIVRHILDDPRAGKTTTELTDVLRDGPDPALFQAPEGYAVLDHRLKTR